LRTAARVARRMAARALPVVTSDSHAAGGAVCAREVMIDLVAVCELRDQRGDLAIDLAAHRHVADVGVHGISEIDHVRPPRQGNQLPLGGEAEHLVVEQLELGVLEKLLRVRAFGEELDGTAQPRIGAGFPRQHLGRRTHSVLVKGMRGDSVLRDLVHIPGADLQFDPLLRRPDHSRMDRTIVVLLGRRDMILEPSRHDRPRGVNNAERLIAFGQ
jgi:hypothetical protein